MAEERDPYEVDWTQDKKSKAAMSKPAAYTEYNKMDLATGFPKDQIWTTKDGRRIAIPNLSDDHLLNIIRYMQNRVTQFRNQLIIRYIMSYTAHTMMFDHISEHAQDAIDDEMSYKIKQFERLSTDEVLKKILPIYGKLYQEAYKRGLTLNGHYANKSTVTEANSFEGAEGVDKWTSGS